MTLKKTRLVAEGWGGANYTFGESFHGSETSGWGTMKSEEIKVKEKRKVGVMRNTTAGRRHDSKSERHVTSTCVFLLSSFALTICTLLREAKSKFKERNCIWYCWCSLPLANQPHQAPVFLLPVLHVAAAEMLIGQGAGGCAVLKAKVVTVPLKILGNLDRASISLSWTRLSQVRGWRWRQGLEFCSSLKKKWCLIHHERSQDLQCLTGKEIWGNTEIHSKGKHGNVRLKSRIIWYHK